MTMTVSVYLNEDRDSFFGFDPAAAALRKAATFDVLVSGHVSEEDAIDRVLEKVFEQLNIDHPDREWAITYRADRNRSLSVGDIVTVGETAWAVARFGWERIDTGALTAAIARHTS